MVTKIGVLGAGGRMGALIIREIASSDASVTIGAAVERPGAAAGAGITADKEGAFKACDVLIDFTTPQATVEHARLAAQYNKPLVVGTTGLGKAEEEALGVAAEKTAIFYTSNMSLGINLLFALVEQAATVLDAAFDIEIFEAHHKYKVDAPSGTALSLARAAAKGRGVRLEDAIVSHFPGAGARKEGTIGMSVFRGGDLAGEHKVTFAGLGERLELMHVASDRAIFARGAVKAALWTLGRPPGLYSMRDILSL